MNPAQGGASKQPPSNMPAQSPASVPPVNNGTPNSLGTNSGRMPPWLKPLYIIIAVCFLIIAGILIWLIAFNKGAKFGTSVVPTPTPVVKKSAQIAGNILFQGYASSEAYLVIAEKAEGESQFESVITGLVPQSGAIPWIWKNATAGANYEIQAQLKVKGNTVLTSTSNLISAPATNVNLVLVSGEQPPAPTTTQITGDVNINGYIPSGANVVITADTTSGAGGQTTLPPIAAVDDTPFTWNGAVSGTSYDLTAQLVSAQGTPIGSPSSINVTAPSSGLQFNINSTAQPPAPTITGLSGNIIINGSIPSSSYITLGTRITGTSSFNQVANNIAATNNASWSWSQASSGTSYDIQAYLWSNSQPYSQSQILTVSAPSDGNTLTINAQQPTGAPGGNTMTISCNGQQSGAFQATINYNTQGNLSNAQSYNIIVTLASTGSQVLNTVVSPPNPTQTQTLTTTYIFTSGATYYAQYAYATSSGGSNFSPLSPAIQFSCR